MSSIVETSGTPVTNLETVILAHQATTQRAKQLAAPLIAASVESFAAIHPEVTVGSDSMPWPLTSEEAFAKSLRKTGQQDWWLKLRGQEDKVAIPATLYRGGIRRVILGELYGKNDPIDRVLPTENIPAVVTRFAHDLVTWRQGMAERGHDLLIAADLGDADIGLTIYADTPDARAFLTRVDEDRKHRDVAGDDKREAPILFIDPQILVYTGGTETEMLNSALKQLTS